MVPLAPQDEKHEVTAPGQDRIETNPEERQHEIQAGQAIALVDPMEYHGGCLSCPRPGLAGALRMNGFYLTHLGGSNVASCRPRGRPVGASVRRGRHRGVGAFGYAEATSAGTAMIVAPDLRVPFRGTASFRHRPHTRRVLTIKTHGPAETAKGTAGALCRARSQTALFDPLTLAPGRADNRRAIRRVGFPDRVALSRPSLPPCYD